MDHNRLVIIEKTCVYSDELKTLVPRVHTNELWRGEGIPSDQQWGDVLEELNRSGRSIEELTRQERRTINLGGVTLPFGWRNIVPMEVEMPQVLPGAELAN